MFSYCPLLRMRAIGNPYLTFTVLKPSLLKVDKVMNNIYLC